MTTGNALRAALTGNAFRPLRQQRFLVTAAALAAFAAYAAIFLPFLPNAKGMVGPDYGYFASQLLAGQFWLERNGLFSVPWFTPAFCGGVPYYPNMQGIYFSAPQFLTFAAGPVRALQMTLLIFAAAGYAGFYLLLRRTFATTAWIALAGAVLFLFNGLHVSRMLVGHLTFHAFMLMPLVAVCALAGRNREGRDSRFDLWVVIAGLLIAYMVQSGMVHALPPAMVGVVVVILVHGYLFGLRAAPFLRLAIAAGIALVLSAAKLAAGMAFLAQFPRDMVPLMGFGEFYQATAIAFLALFFTSPITFKLGAYWTENNHWFQGEPTILARHEYDYGVTFIPLLVLLLWSIGKVAALVKRRPGTGLTGTRKIIVWVIAFLLVVPLFLNWHEPGWTAVLKQLPFFRSSSTMIRWYSLYIPVLILVAVLIVERARLSPGFRAGAGLAIVAGAVALNAISDKTYFRDHATYDMGPATRSHRAVTNGAPLPPVRRVDRLNVRDHVALLKRRDRNDSFLTGGSQAQCYEPMFGYVLENFPVGPLRPGPALEARDGLLNLKNPACFVYPTANACKPGDHFKKSELAAATDFAGYRPFPFKFPWWQVAANWTSLIGLVLMLGFLCFRAGRALHGLLALRRAVAAADAR